MPPPARGCLPKGGGGHRYSTSLIFKEQPYACFATVALSFSESSSSFSNISLIRPL